jgi:hypothetical protein
MLPPSRNQDDLRPRARSDFQSFVITRLAVGVETELSELDLALEAPRENRAPSGVGG